MPTINKIASDLNVGDCIDFAGFIFELIKSVPSKGNLITLDFETPANTKKPSAMSIDCNPTVILKVLI